MHSQLSDMKARCTIFEEETAQVREELTAEREARCCSEDLSGLMFALKFPKFMTGNVQSLPCNSFLSRRLVQSNQMRQMASAFQECLEIITGLERKCAEISIVWSL